MFCVERNAALLFGHRSFDLLELVHIYFVSSTFGALSINKFLKNFYIGLRRVSSSPMVHQPGSRLDIR